MAYGWNQLLVNGALSGTKEDLERYVHQGLVDLVLHEVGHTLGLVTILKLVQYILLNN